MAHFRRLLMHHRGLAVLMLLSGLLVRALVPAGFMPAFEHGSIMIVLCSGSGPEAMTVAMPGMDHHKGKTEHEKSEAPCAFSGLSTPAYAGVDPLLIAAAIAFVMLLAVRTPAVLRAAVPVRWRPPLRGPPLQG